MRLEIVLMTLFFSSQAKPQHNDSPDSNQQKYLAELKIAGKQFTQNFYPNYAGIHSLPERTFVSKIDSVRNKFLDVLNKYKDNLPESFIREQATEIKYYFDKLLIDYLLNHDIYIGKTSSGPSLIPGRLKTNMPDFNKPENCLLIPISQIM